MSGTDRLVQIVSTNGRPSATKEYLAPGSPYRRMSAQDEASFRPVLNVWRPKEKPGTTLLRWLITEWCNYSCPYCPQTHGRWEAKGEEFTAHAFDNFPLDCWIEAFYRHFRERRLSLVITGGEPMIDRRSMVPLLRALTSMETLECIRIDTNAFWKPAWYSQVDKSKLILMCTFHPSQTSEREFFAKVEEILANGFNIGMINYVMSADNKGKYYDRRDKFLALGIPLNPNPLWGSDGKFAKEDIELFNEELPEVDYLYRTETKSPRNKKCLFPAISYELSYIGLVYVGCHPDACGGFFDDELPQGFAGPVPCPRNRCACLDKYSFLESVSRNTDTNPLKTYSQLLLQIRNTDSQRARQ